MSQIGNQKSDSFIDGSDMNPSGVNLPEGSSYPFKQADTGAVTRNAQDKMRESVSVLDFGAVGDGVTNDTTAIQTAINTGKKLYYPAGTYLCNVVISSSFCWQGEGNNVVVLKPFNVGTPCVINKFDPGWAYQSISDIAFVGLATRTGIGFCFGDPTAYETNIENCGRVVFNRVEFRNLEKGFYKPYGNIGNVFNQCTFTQNKYGYYAKGNTVGFPARALMHCGNDVWNGGEFDNNQATAMLAMDVTPYGGMFVFNSTIFQYNPGFGVRIEVTDPDLVSPIEFRNTWDEGNATLPTVSIDTLSGPQTLAPSTYSVVGTHKYELASSYRGIGTTNPQATLGIDGVLPVSLNLLSGNAVGDSTKLAFSSRGGEWVNGAYVEAKRVGSGSNDRDLLFGAGTSRFGMYASGTFVAGSHNNISVPAIPVGSHALLSTDNSAGAQSLLLCAPYAAATIFYVSDSANYSAVATALKVPRIVSTGRSINAGGTVNASGADYAEYERNNGLTFAKGDIVGFKSDGTLTNVFAEAIRFGVKSTDPSYVGGDNWGSEERVGKCPESPVYVAPAYQGSSLPNNPMSEDYADACETWLSDNAKYLSQVVAAESQHESAIAQYKIDLPIFEAKLEAERQQVDRVAYSGKVPVNVFGAVPGGYIVASYDDDGYIVGAFKHKTDLSFEAYLEAVGRVNRILEDGRCEVAVMVH